MAEPNRAVWMRLLGVGVLVVGVIGGLLLAIPSMFLYFFFRGLVSANMADAHKALSHILDLFTGEAQGSRLPGGQEPPLQEFVSREMPDQA